MRAGYKGGGGKSGCVRQDPKEHIFENFKNKNAIKVKPQNGYTYTYLYSRKDPKVDRKLSKTKIKFPTKYSTTYLISINFKALGIFVMKI